ncbi:MAG: aminoacyl-tRNA hydrolase [Actinomycetaceae bacterium]|nr:aminoacyl-tRNA hydrolase [Actinomycetaceae bacterium]
MNEYSPSGKPWLIVGLGNPGTQYAGTRHNIGAMVVEHLVQGFSQKFNSHPAGAHIAQFSLGYLPGGIPGPKVIIARLNSYMNVSGKPTAALCKYFNITPDRLCVIHDDLDLDPWILRLKIGGGEGGHNGLRSISQALGTKDYVRLRCGVGRPPGRQDPADYVLSRFPLAVSTDLEITIAQAADVLEELVVDGLEKTQMRLHTKS